ncbi:MAG TPA: glycosyltransferase family 39 protein [Thermoleophilaceae bacterium]|nr:glycosyltransferase family 39 protein [Thermoleophilaceae bacterium]
MRVAALTLLALATRIVHIDYKSLNGGDEPYSLALAQRPFLDMLELFSHEANGMLYSLVLWPLVHISESEAMLRAPAALAGVASVPALWWAGRTLVNERAGLVAAALLAVSPTAIWYSQLARPFAFVILFSILSFPLLVAALRHGGGWRWAAYVAVMAAAAYSNAFACLVLLPAQLLLSLGYPCGVRRWARSLIALALALAPLATMLVVERLQRDPLYWLERATPRSVGIAVVELATGFSNLKLVTAGIVAVIAAVVGWLALEVRRGRQQAPRELAVIAVWALLPGVILIAVIAPVFRSPYFIGCLPGVLLGTAAALDRMPRRAALGAFVVLLTLLAGASVWQTTRQVSETWRPAMAWIDEQRRPGDPLILDIAAVLPVLGYYDDRYRAPDGDLVVHEWGDRPMPRGVLPYDDPGGYGGTVGPPTRATIARLARGDRRLIVVLAEYVEALQGDVPNSRGLRWARRECTVTRREEFQIYLFAVTGCPAQP